MEGEEEEEEEVQKKSFTVRREAAVGGWKEIKERTYDGRK